MSIASRLRQSQRDSLLGRTKPLSARRAPVRYTPPPFNVTEFQRTAHTQLVESVQESRDSAAGERGATHPRWLAAYRQRVKFWQPWERDGHETEVHYAVEHNEQGLEFALRLGDEGHPLFATAKKAEALGLISLF